MRRCGLVAALSLAALAAPALAAAQDPPPAPLPSLLVVTATLEQVGADLQAELRFNRFLPVAELDAAQGRSVCVVLSPGAPSRRQVCIARRGGRLSASIASIGAGGFADAPARALRRARVVANGDFLRLRAPARDLRVALAGTVRWRVALTWRDGGPCETVPDELACTQVVPPTGEQRLPTHALKPAPGRRAGHLRLLATGDSMIQIVDGFLKSRLRGRRATTVRSDAHISTGISKPAMLNWTRKARGQATGFKPDVTVVFLGANDGFAMKTRRGASVACCDSAWVAEYARRVAAMMRSYRRGGRSLVYWLTLPIPNRDNFAHVFRAVNAAIRRAAADVGDGVRVIDLVKVFTPGGRFRQTITFQGKTINARQSDGIHLSTSGASVAAALILDRLRADGAIPRAR
ncbi:MAG TPA: GDSL-type esterase/lipase family protein [Solirubrobacteraceae bacterium]|nr:GDSL-type esterase/lipase family protein [Solirubrobacteraceae bacterium]